MFQNAFGDGIWQKGLFNFIAARSYDYATSEQLYESIQSAVDELKPSSAFDVPLAMKTWENQPGFPYVTVKRIGNSLQFVQDRFMYELRDSSNLWWLPLNYVVGSNPDFEETKPDLWIYSRSTTVPANSAPKKFTSTDWIIVNIQQTGFYRVNYDISLWKMIIKQLKENFSIIHASNRAQLIDDSFHLARANLISFDTFFEIVVFMENETSYVPWESFYRAYSMLCRWLQGTNVFPKFQAFVQKKVENIFSKLGVEVVKNESMADRYIFFCILFL